MSEQPIDPGDVERTRRYIRQLVQEINHLSGADVPPQQFFGEFLQRVVAAVAAVGGAVWSREGQQPPRLQHQVNFGMSGLLDEAAGASGHVPLLMGAFNNGSAKLIPPHSGAGAAAEREAGSNESDWSLLISPMQVDKETIGVVELLLDPGRRPTALENAVRFVQELCDIGAGYLKNRQLRQMLSQQHKWSQLESFVREIHSSLTPKEVSYIVANEGKRMVGCDRLSVALLYGRKTVIEGVSGQEVIERKSTLVQLLNHLCRTVLQNGENLLYTGEQREDLPPAVRDSLDDYVAESGSKILGITLLQTVDKEGAKGKPFGCLVGEQLEDASQPGTLIPHMEVVGQHGAIALANALSHHRVFMLPVWRTVGNATEWMRGNRLAKLSIAVAGATVTALAMWLVQVDLRMKGKGNLVPENHRPVYAEEDGIIDRVDVESNQIVRPRDAILHIRSDQLDLELNNRRQDYLKAQASLNQALSELGPAGPGGPAGPSTSAGGAARVAEHDMVIHAEQMALLQKRKETTEVRSPIEGLIAAFDPKRTLFGLPVKRGQELLVVSQVEGKDANGNDVRWVLKVRMPERNMGHIREAESKRLADNDPEPLQASFILSSYPQKTFYAHVEHINSTAEFDQDLKEHIVMIRIVPDNVVRFFVELKPADENPNIQRVANVQMEMANGDTIKLSPEAEVKAKVDCGKCSLAYWTLGELVEWFYEVVWF